MLPCAAEGYDYLLMVERLAPSRLFRRGFRGNLGAWKTLIAGPELITSVSVSLLYLAKN